MYLFKITKKTPSHTQFAKIEVGVVSGFEGTIPRGHKGRPFVEVQ